MTASYVKLGASGLQLAQLTQVGVAGSASRRPTAISRPQFVQVPNSPSLTSFFAASKSASVCSARGGVLRSAGAPRRSCGLRDRARHRWRHRSWLPRCLRSCSRDSPRAASSSCAVRSVVRGCRRIRCAKSSGHKGLLGASPGASQRTRAAATDRFSAARYPDVWIDSSSHRGVHVDECALGGEVSCQTVSVTAEPHMARGDAPLHPDPGQGVTSRSSDARR